jgi:hypothetical protein
MTGSGKFITAYLITMLLVLHAFLSVLKGKQLILLYWTLQSVSLTLDHQ